MKVKNLLAFGYYYCEYCEPAGWKRGSEDGRNSHCGKCGAVNPLWVTLNMLRRLAKQEKRDGRTTRKK